MNDMTLDPALTAVCAVIFAAIIVLHVLPLLLRWRGSHALSLVCVGLHVPLMPLMLFAGFTLETMVLAYVLSAFVHTLSRYICYELRERKNAAEENGEVSK